MTVKIFDNTVISVSINELHSINLIQLCSTRYDITTTHHVFTEAKKGFSKAVIKEMSNYISVSNSQNQRFNEVLSWLELRFPYLHKGELSTFLMAVLDYSQTNKKYYYVTDDGRMRKTIPKILQNQAFINMCGKNKGTFNCTGTIGLIKRLYEKGSLTDNQIEEIITDLRNSTFYITPSLLNSLRRTPQ
jgi:predicted nucleic acid-binding protein